MLEFCPSRPFVFTVNGEEFPTTLAEAILLSPKVCEFQRSNPQSSGFDFASGSIDATDFGSFVEFVGCRALARIGRARALSFISISEQLGNESLTLALLSSLNIELNSMMTGESVVSERDPNIGVSIATIDRCASEFFLYSKDEIRCLDGRTLHRLLSSDSLLIESEDSLLKMLLALGDDGRDFFSYIEVKFLSSTGIGLFLSELAFDELTVLIWGKIVSRLTAGDCQRWNENRHRGCFESTISRTIPPILKEFCASAWTLLYRGSRDGFAASNFHGKCDGHSNTISLIETTNGYIFGGFTPVAWESPTSWTYKLEEFARDGRA
jgi:hypothetical protein